jgi:DNA-binding NtrC family response regulator
MVNRLVRVLHVDDLEEEFILLRELLSEVEDVEFEVQWVADIRTAMHVIHTMKFDICLVDYHLGIDKGIDLIHMALANDIRMPFILMTGQNDPSIEREALKIGARLCIDKNDITTSILLKAIQEALKN